MSIVVIGGTGLIGSKLVPLLRERGEEVVVASPNSGVNTLTGAGLAEADAVSLRRLRPATRRRRNVRSHAATS